MESTASLTNQGSSSDNTKSSNENKPWLSPIFVLCDFCYWCATYFDKTKIPTDNICPHCGANNNELTSFPILSNEAFTFDHNDKRGVELEFKPRHKRA